VAMKLGAIMFACDGVLVDSDSDGHRLALNMAMRELNLDIECSEEQYGKLLHMRDVQRIEQFWKDANWKGMDVETALKVYEKKSAIFQKLVSEGKVPVRKGVAKLIDEALAAGVPVAVCSSNTHAAVKEVVGSLGTAKAPKLHIFAGDDVVRRKPFPDVYQLAQIKLGVNPEDCVVFEDNQAGLEAAKAAGMLCVITRSKYTQKEEFPKADVVVDDLESGEINLEAVAAMAFNMQGLNA